MAVDSFGGFVLGKVLLRSSSCAVVYELPMAMRWFKAIGRVLWSRVYQLCTASDANGAGLLGRPALMISCFTNHLKCCRRDIVHTNCHDLQATGIDRDNSERGNERRCTYRGTRVRVHLNEMHQFVGISVHSGCAACVKGARA